MAKANFYTVTLKKEDVNFVTDPLLKENRKDSNGNYSLVDCSKEGKFLTLCLGQEVSIRRESVNYVIVTVFDEDTYKALKKHAVA